MKRRRDRALELLDTCDLADCIEGGRPTWIPSDIWRKLIHDNWTTSNFKELSKKNKKNRLNKKDGDVTYHVGGSICT